MYNSFPIETETLPYGFVFKFDTLKLTGSSFKSRQDPKSKSNATEEEIEKRMKTYQEGDGDQKLERRSSDWDWRRKREIDSMKTSTNIDSRKRETGEN
ncbi:hypothetical protein F2Q69_00024585 [Brassica cretica]|uniref:Uncharacterized protein n=1 Tax=Brassica cretica TaxID=69181 RepID=A0A8S9Q7J5_BRACR|nr:hypothetical protein F2Q69_00024585 [Brassica cretica]